MARSSDVSYIHGKNCWVVKTPGVIVTINRVCDGPIDIEFSLDPERRGKASDKQNLAYAKGLYKEALLAVARDAFKVSEKDVD